jgi:hypothetical protein
MEPMFILFTIVFFLILGITISPRSHGIHYAPMTHPADLHNYINRKAWLYVIVLLTLLCVLACQLNDLSEGRLWEFVKTLIDGNNLAGKNIGNKL